MNFSFRLQVPRGAFSFTLVNEWLHTYFYSPPRPLQPPLPPSCLFKEGGFTFGCSFSIPSAPSSIEDWNPPRPQAFIRPSPKAEMEKSSELLFSFRPPQFFSFFVSTLFPYNLGQGVLIICLGARFHVFGTRLLVLLTPSFVFLSLIAHGRYYLLKSIYISLTLPTTGLPTILLPCEHVIASLCCGFGATFVCFHSSI